MLCFAAMMWLTADWGAAPSLTLASLIWLTAATGLWLLRRQIRRPKV